MWFDSKLKINIKNEHNIQLYNSSIIDLKLMRLNSNYYTL